MGWDAARVSAAIPSGVGFLGSALIWKESTGQQGPYQRHHVHGITTAASVWLSASVGIGVGGGLYIMSIWTVVLVVFVLRLGPKLAFQDDSSYAEDHGGVGGAAAMDGSRNDEDHCEKFHDSDWDTTQHDDGDEKPNPHLQEMFPDQTTLAHGEVQQSTASTRRSDRPRKPMQRNEPVNFHSD